MKIRLTGGDIIIHKGKEFKVSKRCSINATLVNIGEQEEQEANNFDQEELKGEQKSDIPDPIDRTKALELFNEYLSVLEDHQSELLRRESFRDDELETSEQETGEHYKASVYAASVVYISELKTLVDNVGKL